MDLYKYCETWGRNRPPRSTMLKPELGHQLFVPAKHILTVFNSSSPHLYRNAIIASATCYSRLELPNGMEFAKQSMRTSHLPLAGTVLGIEYPDAYLKRGRVDANLCWGCLDRYPDSWRYLGTSKCIQVKWSRGRMISHLLKAKAIYILGGLRRMFYLVLNDKHISNAIFYVRTPEN